MAVEHANISVIDSKEAWNGALAEAIRHKKTVVVDFTATWCGPCRLIAPLFEELSKRHHSSNSTLVFLKVDVDEFQEIASEWEVRAMPTFLFIRDGKLADKIVGANKDELVKKVEAFANAIPAEEDQAET